MSELRPQFLEGMSCVAATVTVVTTNGPAGRAGVTVSAMSSVSADTEAPTLLVCINQASAGVEPILANGSFCVNILRDDQSFVSDTFAGRHGDKGEEKFRCGKWTKGATGSPMLDGALVSFDCRLADRRLVGTHHVLFGEVQQVRLSEGGRALVYANRAYSTPLRLRPHTGGSSNAGPAALQIACVSSFAPFFLPGLLARIRKAGADLNIDVREGDQAQALYMLESGEADLALVYNRQLPDGFAVQPLLEQQPYALLPQGHNLARNEVVSLSDLAKEPMILLDAPLSRDYFAGLFATAGLKPSFVMRTASFEMLRGLVANGLGCSLLVTRPHGASSYDGMPLVERRLSEPVESIGIALVSSRATAESTAAAMFCALCSAYFDDVATDAE